MVPGADPVRCPVCGGQGSPVGEIHGIPMAECCCRGRVLLSGAWTDEAEPTNRLKEWYAAGGYHRQEQDAQGMLSPEARDTEYLRAALERLKAYYGRVPAGRLLDVGCGCGAFVAMASAWGYEAAGLEPGVEQVHLGARLGRAVSVGGWEQASGQWDVITLLDVWEHLPDPRAALGHLGACLAPGGVLVVEYPEWGCPKTVQEGLDWRHVKPLQHLFLADETAARAMFTAWGFRVVTVDRPRSGALEKITFFLQRDGVTH